MTNICYTLEEAAEKLKFSETVLVRLSQYLKVPQAAYEESGYLSFKGDLEFSEQDLTFFAQVKERLLMGESLDDVKNRLPQVVTSAVEPVVGVEVPNQIQATKQGQPSVAQPSAILEELGQEPDVLGGTSSTLPGELPPMREIQDRKPYEKAAEKSFERYKSLHRSSIGKVFENMLKEVGGPQPSRRTEAATPAYRPIRNKLVEDPGQDLTRADAMLPFFDHWFEPIPETSGSGFSQPAAMSGPSKIPAAPSRPSKPVRAEAIWEPLIQQAAQKPRAMNIQLKNAALILRERTLGHSSGGHSSSQEMR